MPLHVLSRMGAADALSLVTSTVFLTQPFVDREALMQWFVDAMGGPENTKVWGLQVVHKSFEYFMLALFTLIYAMELPVFERHKVMPSVPWPWKSDKKEVREEYGRLVARSLRFIATFHLGVLALNWLLVKPERLDLVDPATIPSRLTVVLKIMAGTLCAETGFYFGHRLLHTKMLYKYHKRHHEYKDSSVYATLYVGVVDAIITDIIPAGVAIVGLDMHMYTTAFFTISLISNAFIVHCGYRWPSRLHPFILLPFATEAEITHDLHHRKSVRCPPPRRAVAAAAAAAPPPTLTHPPRTAERQLWRRLLCVGQAAGHVRGPGQGRQGRVGCVYAASLSGDDPVDA